MASIRQFQGNMHSTKVASCIADSLVHRFTGLSLASHGTTSARRGYARVAKVRPKSPKTPLATSLLSSTVSTSTGSPLPTGTSAGTMVEAELKSMDAVTRNIKLPSKFKLAKVQTIEEYDPNMVIFLDKHGSVTMIPHDDRAKGQTRDEYDAVLPGGDIGEPNNVSQRGSKEMEYGRKRIGQVEMPKAIQDAIREVLDEQDKSLIRTDALRLYGSLRSTSALDDDSIDPPAKRLKSGSGDMGSKGDKPAPAHILEYGHRESTAYIAAMAPTTYSAIKNVLEEVKGRVPDLQVKTFMDFGTGPGTGIWAANEVWEMPLQYTGVDVSLAMLETAEEILDVLSSKGTPISNITFKPFLSHGSQASKHDVVLSAFTLSEITTPALRKSTLEHLWESTNDMLILVDRGTPNGFKILAEAREQILGLDADRIVSKTKYDAYGNELPEDEVPKRGPAHVLAPCPHDKRKTKHSKENFEDSKYTYVVLRKGARPVFTQPSPPVPVVEESSQPQSLELNSESTESEDGSSTKRKKYKKLPPPPPVTYNSPEEMLAASHAWSRIVVPPLKKDGHVVMDTCAANGYLERIVIPKSQGKIPYRDARKAMWGDLFPHVPKNRPVRKETIKNMFDGGETQMNPKKRPQGISAEMLMKRMKQKEKKQSRQKVSLDEIDGAKRSRKSNRGQKDQDIIFDL
ncbi:37S ribosomal protein S22 [Mortierella sp. AM989]|nr:37S ribosomal protein S22 [Mortierella sp. AM989]